MMPVYNPRPSFRLQHRREGERGNEEREHRNISVTRIRMSSTQPPKYAASEPTVSPTTSAIAQSTVLQGTRWGAPDHTIENVILPFGRAKGMFHARRLRFRLEPTRAESETNRANPQGGGNQRRKRGN